MIRSYTKVILLAGMVAFSGCGSSSDKSYETPIQKVVKTPNSKNNIDTDKTDIVKQDATFATIKSMISRSLSGELKDVTYISIGDSTRAYTNFDGYVNHSENIFRDVDATLKQYNVKSFLVAEGGLAFETFLGRHYANDTRDDWINYMRAVEKIPADGSTTIVNISMISNDFSRLNEQYKIQYNITDKTPTDTLVKIYKDHIYADIHDDLIKVMRETITTLRSYKPNIHIMLTSPNPMQQWEGGSDAYAKVYQEIADEMNLPYANLVKDKMPKREDKVNFDSWYGDHIHFSTDDGMPATAEYILDQILP